MKRIISIDFVRGLAMIIMALDHVRDLLHIHSIDQSPADLATTTPILFFTRWITYLCAPIFVFLAGVSAYISSKNKNNIAAAQKHLIKRGLWLILLEFTVVNFGLYFDPGFHNLLFEVIAAIGFGFIVLGALLKFPAKALGIAGLIILCLHNLVPPVPLPGNPIFRTILMFFFNPGATPLFADRVFVMAYPPIPWLGIILTGFACGQLFEPADIARKKTFIRIGLAAWALFFIVRFVNVYGDPIPWSSQKSSLFTLLSFMNVSKYPPSLLFCLVTLGIMFLLLAFADQFNKRIQDMVSVYGKVPLFYFVLHFYLIHLITLIVLLGQGFHFSQLSFATGNFGRPTGMESGLHLWAIYLIWIGVVIVLYKPCRWYGRYKSAHKKWWLSYL